MTRNLPKAILIDLDDTILEDSGVTLECWREACVACCAPKTGVDPDALLESIQKTRNWYWSNSARHRDGRLDLDRARQEVVSIALAGLNRDAPALAEDIARRYGAMREERIRPFPDAVETVRWLRARGHRLALLTNGNAISQRAKVDRFQLAELFHVILIEGELGFGKPDPRIYAMALDALRASAEEAWIVGDNYEWEVVHPKRLGMTTVWVDVLGEGPPKHEVAPDRVIRTLSELRTLIA